MATNANTNASNQSQDEAGSLSGQCPMQPLGVDVIPVRYAIDFENEHGEGTFGLPKQWRGNGIFQRCLVDSNYTLRQLRDGWLYVLADYDETFHEYEVKGSNFIKYDLDTWVKEKGKTNRGSAGEQKPFLTYNQNNTLYLAWSKERWSWRLFNFVLANKSNSRRWMRRVSLNQYCRTLNANHCGKADEISESVADVSDNTSDDILFSGHMAPTAQASDNENDNEETEIKPVASKGAFTASMNDVKSAFFVALDDPFTDLQDLSLALSREVYILNRHNEDKQNKAILLETTAQVTGLHTLKELQYPASVKNGQDKQKYYNDLANYYDEKNNLELLTRTYNNTPSNSTTSTYSEIHAAKYRYAKKKFAQTDREFRQKYNDVVPNDKAFFERWKETEKWRNEIDHHQLRADIEDFNENEAPEITAQTKKVQRYCSQLKSSCQQFGWDPTRGFIDIETQEGQFFLSEVHYFLIESMSTALDKKAVKWLKSEFNMPTTIVPLYLSGFSKDLFEKIQKIKPEKNDLITANDYDDLENRFAEFNDVLSTDTVQNSTFYKSLTQPLKNTMLAFTSSILVQGDNAISTIAQKGASLLTIANDSNFIHLNFIAEKYALNTPIKMNKNYHHELDLWKTRKERLSFQLENLEREKDICRRAIKHNIQLGNIDNPEKEVKIIDKEIEGLKKQKDFVNEKIKSLENNSPTKPLKFRNAFVDEVHELNKALRDTESQLKELNSELEQIKVGKRSDVTVAGLEGVTEEMIEEQKQKLLKINKETTAKINKLQNHFSETPSLFYVAKDNVDDISQDFRNSIKNSIKKGTKISIAKYEKLGGFGFILFLLNINDLQLAFSSMQEKSIVSEREKDEVLQKIGYSMSALGQIFQTRVWVNTNLQKTFYSTALSELLKDNTNKLTLIKYLKITRMVAILNLIAMGSEIYYTLYDMERSTGILKLFHAIKLGSLFYSSSIATIQVIATILKTFFSVNIFIGAIVTTLAFISGLIYIIATMVINALTKDDYQKWLVQTPWGSKPNSLWNITSNEGVANALIGLYRLTNAPKIKVLNIFEVTTSSNSYPVAQQKIRKTIYKLEIPTNVNHEDIEISLIEPKDIKIKNNIWIKSPNKSKKVLNELKFRPKNSNVFELELEPIEEMKKADISVNIRYSSNLNDPLSEIVNYRFVFENSWNERDEKIISPLTKDEYKDYVKALYKKTNSPSNLCYGTNDILFNPGIDLCTVI